MSTVINRNDTRPANEITAFEALLEDQFSRTARQLLQRLSHLLRCFALVFHGGELHLGEHIPVGVVVVLYSCH